MTTADGEIIMQHVVRQLCEELGFDPAVVADIPRYHAASLAAAEEERQRLQEYAERIAPAVAADVTAQGHAEGWLPEHLEVQPPK